MATARPAFGHEGACQPEPGLGRRPWRAVVRWTIRGSSSAAIMCWQTSHRRSCPSLCSASSGPRARRMPSPSVETKFPNCLLTDDAGPAICPLAVSNGSHRAIASQGGSSGLRRRDSRDPRRGAPDSAVCGLPGRYHDTP